MLFRFAFSFRALFVSGGQNPRGKNKTFCAKSLAPRRPARQVCRWFHSLLDHGKSEGIRICVCLHPRRGRPTRRDARREARRKKNKEPHLSNLLSPRRFRFRFRFRSRRLRRCRLRRFVERDEENARVFVERQRGRAGERLERHTSFLARSKTKSAFWSEKPRDARLFPSPPFFFFVRRFGACVTKEGVSAPDRSLEKSANAFLMSDDARRREERVSRRKTKNKKQNQKGKENPAAASVRANTSESTGWRRRSRPRSRRRLTGITYYSSLAALFFFFWFGASAHASDAWGLLFHPAGGARDDGFDFAKKKKKNTSDASRCVG